MKLSWAVALACFLLASVPVASQVDPVSGPAMTVLVHHPFPDPADPLGAPMNQAGNASVDAFAGRYQRYDTARDGFGYPSLVVDGIVPIEGLPDGDAPYVATRSAYTAALAQREGEDAPAALEVSARLDGDRVLIQVIVAPRADLAGDDLQLWVAAVEDHVFFEPPAALSNGVTDHRFTVRETRLLGSLADMQAAGDGSARQAGTVLDVDGAWARDQLYVSAWLQQGPTHGLRFDPLEVVQATTHRVLDGGVTRQETKGVLLELYSATWCGPCLYGDTVVEELAGQRGHPAYLAQPAGDGFQYLQRPETPWLAVAAALAGAALMAGGRLGGRP